MTTPLDTLSETLREVRNGWTSYTAVATFLLYVVGYLTLRFHLTALGVGTDLAVLDERYLFAGGKFVVYLVSAVPIVVLLALITLGTLYLLYRLSPESVRIKLYALCEQKWFQTHTVLWVGIAFSVLMIQLVMRHCYFFSNLVLAKQLPKHWLSCLLVSGDPLVKPGDGAMQLFFSGLIAGTVIPAAILFLDHNHAHFDESWRSRLLFAVLAFLVGVQLLLLPVNYGTLIMDKAVPSVASMGTDRLAQGQQAWLVWEGREGATYLLREANNGSRSLVTLPRSEVKRVEITGYDPIFAALFPDTKKEVGCGN